MHVLMIGSAAKTSAASMRVRTPADAASSGRNGVER